MNHVVVWFLGYVGSAADSRPCPTYHPAHGSRLARLGQDGARRVVRPSRCALLGRSSHRPTMRRVRAAHSGRQRMRGGRTRWPRVRSSRVPYGVVARVTGPAREAGLHRPFVSGFAPRGRRTRPAAADAPAPEVRQGRPRAATPRRAPAYERLEALQVLHDRELVCVRPTAHPWREAGWLLDVGAYPPFALCLLSGI